MLSKTSRSFTYLNAILYTILGTFLFPLPRNYTGLRVEGGWCLDNAWLAWVTALGVGLPLLLFFENIAFKINGYHQPAKPTH